MRTIILDPSIIRDNEILKENDTLGNLEELVPIIIVPVKRFGIVDLWNIRKKGKFSKTSRNIL